MKMLITGAVALLIAVPAAPATAQSGWAAFQGCWRLAEEDAPTNALVCVLPGADAQSVRIVTYEDGVAAAETVLRADGVARPFEDEGCTGTETAAFSRDGRRVYTRAELDCSGVRRVSTGVMAFVSEVEWLDAQAMTVSGQSAARTVRYTAVPRSAVPAAAAALLPADQRLALEAARLYAAAPLGVDDVIEASAAVSDAAVEALLGARQHGFGLNAAALLELESRGVPASTIDVMVALSYPQRYAVEQRTGGGYGRASDRDGFDAWQDDCRDQRWSSRRYRAGCFSSSYYGYDRYGYGFGYSPWGYDPWGWQYNRPIVIVQPRTPDDGGTVSKGQGYTSGTAPSRGTARPRTPAPSRDSGTARAAPATGSAGPATGSSGSTGRTAKPRRGGGGGEGGGEGGGVS